MKKIAKCSLIAATVAAFSVATTSAADAQVCVGFPTAPGQGAVGLTANFPTGGDVFGAEAGYNFGTLSAFGGFQVEGRDEASDITTFGGGVAFDFPALTEALPAGISVCPTVSVAFANAGGIDDDNVFSVPIGLGFGTSLALGEALTLSPWVVPQFRWRHLGGPDDSTDTEWLISGGALLTGFLGPLYAGATVNRVFLEGQESVLGFKIGVTF